MLGDTVTEHRVSGKDFKVVDIPSVLHAQYRKRGERGDDCPVLGIGNPIRNVRTPIPPRCCVALKVMTILGTRPEIIRLSRVIAALDRHTEHVVVHTGQNYDFELSQVFFDDLEIRPPDRYLSAAGQSAAETIGQVIIAADKVLGEMTPDAVLILGDTNSCLAAIAAKRRRVPVFHMEAGNRCFDMRVPRRSIAGSSITWRM